MVVGHLVPCGPRDSWAADKTVGGEQVDTHRVVGEREAGLQEDMLGGASQL